MGLKGAKVSGLEICFITCMVVCVGVSDLSTSGIYICVVRMSVDIS